MERKEDGAGEKIGLRSLPSFSSAKENSNYLHKTKQRHTYTLCA